ncbi:hypothetical protein ACQEVS_20195 [Streptomyces sp. CA-181903]|uniref:hypothetical protein n=1 Tax=Streptomyces sp. CA-181903 TaxID=3240055 RepID=UPI003D937492
MSDGVPVDLSGRARGLSGADECAPDNNLPDADADLSDADLRSSGRIGGSPPV